MAYITVDLEQFDDEDIRDEYHARNLGDNDPDAHLVSIDDMEILTRIWIHDREGRKDEAYTLMREYVLEKLNKVV
jgi:hypothetical protein